jgi:hypothetical protein
VTPDFFRSTRYPIFRPSLQSLTAYWNPSQVSKSECGSLGISIPGEGERGGERGEGRGERRQRGKKTLTLSAQNFLEIQSYDHGYFRSFIRSFDPVDE